MVDAKAIFELLKKERKEVAKATIKGIARRKDGRQIADNKRSSH